MSKGSFEIRVITRRFLERYAHDLSEDMTDKITIKSSRKKLWETIYYQLIQTINGRIGPFVLILSSHNQNQYLSSFLSSAKIQHVKDNFINQKQ